MDSAHFLKTSSFTPFPRTYQHSNLNYSVLHWGIQTLCPKLSGAHHFALPEASDRTGSKKGFQQQPASRNQSLLQPCSDTSVHTCCCCKAVLPTGRKATWGNCDWIYKRDFFPFSFIYLLIFVLPSILSAIWFALNLCSFLSISFSLPFCSPSKVFNCFTLTQEHFTSEIRTSG